MQLNKVAFPNCCHIRYATISGKIYARVTSARGGGHHSLAFNCVFEELSRLFRPALQLGTGRDGPSRS
jgi:hypothetical protein